MKYVKTIEWLKDQQKDEEVRIIDCRFSLTDPAYGLSAYHQGHIPGAVYFDLEKDLSGKVQKHGGRHPMPDIDMFNEKLKKAGIDHQIKVLVYDDGDGAFASRFWWLLSYLGHEDVYVMDGGYQAWLKAQYPISTERPTFEKTNFTPKLKDEMLASYEEVKDRSDQVILIDARAKERFLGLTEPIDAKPGRIPGAVNYEWTEGLKDGRWKNTDAQTKRFEDLNQTDPIIVYCGSGVTATPNIIALKESGYLNVKLYAGSYSDWVSYDDNPVEKG